MARQRTSRQSGASTDYTPTSTAREHAKAEKTIGRRLGEISGRLDSLADVGERLIRASARPCHGSPADSKASQWGPLKVIAVIASIAGIVSLVVTICMIAPAIQSLEAAQAALQRDEISQTFNVTFAACIRIEESPLRVSSLGTELNTVITNTGRLPITIIDVESDVDGMRPVAFHWRSLDRDSPTAEGGPLYLEVGKAVAIQVFVPGNTFNSVLHFVLSNGTGDQAAHFEPFIGDLPRLITSAYDKFTPMCGS